MTQLRDPSGRREKQLARGLIVMAGGGLALLAALWPAALDPAVRTILEHALEGAVVGGLCDAFAVWKTFSAVETSAADVADGLGQFVGAELLGASVVEAAVRDALARPEAREASYRALDQWLGSEADCRARFSRYWEDAVPTAAGTLADLDLGDVGAGLGRPAILDDVEAVAVVRACAGAAVEALAADDEFWRLVQLALEPMLTAVPLGFGKMAAGILVGKARERLRNPGGMAVAPALGDTLAPLVERALTVGGPAYLRGWTALPRAQRVQAAGVLLGSLSAPAVEALTTRALAARDHLSTLDAFSSHPLVRSATDSMLPGVAQGISERSTVVIAAILRTRSGGQLRAVVEANVGRYLQLIRVNGTALGFLAGGAIGAVLWLAGG